MIVTILKQIRKWLLPSHFMIEDPFSSHLLTLEQKDEDLMRKSKKLAEYWQDQLSYRKLPFLYRQVLGIELPYIDNIERPKRPARLPVVFTRSEVKAILAHLDGVHHLMASLLYGSGLRLIECLVLRVKDVDFEDQQVTVRDGKGRKYRVTMLPNSVIDPLKLERRKASGSL